MQTTRNSQAHNIQGGEMWKWKLRQKLENLENTLEGKLD